MHRALTFLLLCSCCLSANAQARFGTSQISRYWTQTDLYTNSTPGGGGASADYTAKLIAYFACEDADPGPAVDAVSAANVPKRSGTITPISGKSGFNNAFDLGQCAFRKTSDSFYEFHGHDFCIRFWYYTSDHTYNEAIISHAWWVVRQRGDGNIEFVFTPSSGPDKQVQAAQGTDATWHRVIVWNKTGTEIGIKIDDNTAVTTSATNPLLFTGPDWFEFRPSFGAPPPTTGLDEVAVWKDYVLVSGDMTYDWNSGIGRGQP